MRVPSKPQANAAGSARAPASTAAGGPRRGAVHPLPPAKRVDSFGTTARPPAVRVGWELGVVKEIMAKRVAGENIAPAYTEQESRTESPDHAALRARLTHQLGEFCRYGSSSLSRAEVEEVSLALGGPFEHAESRTAAAAYKGGPLDKYSFAAGGLKTGDRVQFDRVNADGTRETVRGIVGVFHTDTARPDLDSLVLLTGDGNGVQTLGRNPPSPTLNVKSWAEHVKVLAGAE